MGDPSGATSHAGLEHPGAALFEPQPPGRTFLNAAYMTPKPKRALAAMHACVDRLASPDFGAVEFFEPLERVRALLARVVGGPAESYSLVGAASYGMATVAWNLRCQADALVGARRRIVGVDGQFPSNVQTWRRLADAGFELVLVANGDGVEERLLAELDDRAALLAIAPLSWTNGCRLDVARLCGAAREAGALSLLDVTQSVGVDPAIPMERCDIVTGAGYKWLLGPYGTGFLRLSPELQERLEPLEANWKNFAGSQDFNRLTDYADDFASPAAKFDQGESSAFVRLAGWEPGLQTLVDLGEGAIAAHVARLHAAVREALDGARFDVSPSNAAIQASHLFRVAPRDAADFDPLSEQLAAAGVGVSRRDGGWRLSPHVYNGGEDVARFVAALSGDRQRA